MIKNIKYIVVILVLSLGVISSYAGEPGSEEHPNIVNLKTAVETPPTAIEPEPQPITIESPDVIKVQQDVDIIANPIKTEVSQPIDVSIKPDVSVTSQPVTIVSEPNVRVFGGTPLVTPSYSVSQYYPPQYYVPNNNVSMQESVLLDQVEIPETPKENAWGRLQDGLCEVITFWKPLSAPNTPEINATALQNANGFSEKADQGFRNFFIKGSLNSARRLGEGAWKTATFPFPKSS